MSFSIEPLKASVAGLALLGVAACSQPAPVIEGEPGVVNARRITESQYRNTIDDIFGEGIEIRGRFEPDMRDEGLLAIGSAQLSITPSGFEQYYSMASAVASGALNEERRETTVSCTPSDEKAADAECARATLSKYGELLYRRPLTEAELDALVAVTANVADAQSDFYAGLQEGLTTLLVSPDFLFRIETAEAIPGKDGAVRLDGYAKASRLSHFFWDSSPDAELLAIAANGEIHNSRTLEAQIERLTSSDKSERGARAFFRDMLQFDKFATLNKDPQIFPKFSLAVADSAQEQTLRTLVSHLVEKEGDYRDIFTTRDTFLDRTLAAVYKVPYLGDGDWVEYTAPEDANRDGVLTHVSFLSAFSHPGRSSPTLRGVAVNEVYLCEPTPLPPANVDFSIVNDTENVELRTVRDRLMAHSLDESCSSCHDLSDPVGLTLEHYDSIGQFRMEENGAIIDVAAEINGKPVEGASGLAQSLKEDDKVPACLVQNLYAYGIGRAAEPTEADFLEAQTNKFARNGYKYPDLLKQLAGTPEFFGFDPIEAGATQSASNKSNTTGGHQ